MKTGGRPITGTAVSLGAGCILLLTGVVAVRGGSGERLPQTPHALANVNRPQVSRGR